MLLKVGTQVSNALKITLTKFHQHLSCGSQDFKGWHDDDDSLHDQCYVIVLDVNWTSRTKSFHSYATRNSLASISTVFSSFYSRYLLTVLALAILRHIENNFWKQIWTQHWLMDTMVLRIFVNGSLSRLWRWFLGQFFNLYNSMSI